MFCIKFLYYEPTQSNHGCFFNRFLSTRTTKETSSHKIRKYFFHAQGNLDIPSQFNSYFHSFFFERKCLMFSVHLLQSKLSKDIVCGFPNRVCSVKAVEKLLFSTINASNFKNILWTSHWVFMYLLCRKTFFSQQLM